MAKTVEFPTEWAIVVPEDENRPDQQQDGKPGKETTNLPEAKPSSAAGAARRSGRSL